MLKQMEIRFTIVAISVISLVLLFLVLTVQFVNSKINVRKADVILSSIAAESPEVVFNNMSSMASESFKTFSVETQADDDFEVAGLGIVERDVAVAMAKEAISDDGKSGFIDDYRYLIVSGEDTKSIYFLDYTFEQDSARNLWLVSLAIYGISVLLVVVLVKVFMKFVMKPIKESYEKQKQFITDASHELKTPLTIIGTNMQLVEMESGSSKWIKSTNKQVERLTKLTNELVELSSMDENSNRLELKGLNLSELVSDVVYGVEPALIADGKELKANIEQDIKIDGDYDAVEKVVSILMENSLKYSSEDSKIKVKLMKRNKKISFSVENAVENIEQGNHNKFFERFYRADKSRNSENGGFGIGLAVAKSIVEQHNGRIDAYSPDGEKIVFKVEF